MFFAEAFHGRVLFRVVGQARALFSVAWDGSVVAPVKKLVLSCRVVLDIPPKFSKLFLKVLAESSLVI